MTGMDKKFDLPECSAKATAQDNISGGMLRISRGKYIKKEAAKDRLYFLQMKYSRGIFSYETALYLHGFLESEPEQITMTFPQGYNVPSLKDEGVLVKKVIRDNYSMEIETQQTIYGNPIRVYSIERTLCDILRGRGSDIYVIGAAMKQYAARKDRDIPKLMRIAEQLRVGPKVRRYL